MGFQAIKNIHADGDFDIWWPTNNAKISDTQAFKVMLKDKNVTDYDMTWSVDGGQLNPMYDSSTDYPHKEATVDVKSWTWKGSGPYKITFKAADKTGKALGESSVDIYTPDAKLGPVEVRTSSSESSILSTASQALGVPTASASDKTDKTITVWWPTIDAVLSGTHPLKAAVDTLDVEKYDMYWQVDRGQLNPMQTAYSDAPHKEASVNFDSWNWNSAGAYTITFVAKQGDAIIASRDIPVKRNISGQVAISDASVSTNSLVRSLSPKKAPASIPVAQTLQTTTVSQAAPVPQAVTVSSPAPAPAAVVSEPEVLPSGVQSSNNPLSGVKFFINPNSNAKRTADEWRNARPADATQMDKIANSPEAIWLGGWNSDVQKDVSNKIGAAKSQGAVPVFIAYNIPNRDCGSYSAGGVSNADSYRSWIGKIAAGLGGGKAVVILEPDALTLTDCLGEKDRKERYGMLSEAITTLKNAGAVVYLDAGHSNWVGVDDISARLNSAGISKADGFALNTSNFQTTQSNTDYGMKVSAKVGGKHFVIDTARNGQGPNGSEWCNPAGRGLGVRSTTNTGNSLVDGFLWLKNPGESDGNCNGGPSAGVWWPEYALGLAQRSAF